MRFRNARVRTKITAMLLSLAALWVFAAWVTLREGLNLISVSQIDQKVSRPVTQLINDLEAERKLTLVHLARPGTVSREELVAQRTRTDQAQRKFQRDTSSRVVDFAAGSLVETRIAQLTQQLKELAPLRTRVDTGVVQRGTAAQGFTGIVDSAFRIFTASSGVDDEEISRAARSIITLNRAKEMLSREDALLSGVLATGRMTAAEQAEFGQLVGIQRMLIQEALSELPGSDQERYARYDKSEVATRLRVLEDRIVNARPGARLTFTQVAWNEAASAALTESDDMVRATADGLVEKSLPVAAGVVVRLVLAGGLGFLAVVASVMLSVTTARHLVRQLERLKEAAHELSNVRLPNVVERLGHGEQVDVEAEAPPLSFGDDDIGKVGQAFNAVQETAIRTAVEQAELRRGIRDILLSLARRSQALVHRQLTLLDQMERREIDTEELEDLFRLDHLATRMRRNAENLIILSGATPARGWRKPVPMVDVVRSAVAEVEDYTRVTVMPIDEVHLVGRAVADIAHLLAELIENAVSFSPPYTYAQISGHMVASGYALEIEDRGLGMSDDSLESINRKIADPPEFNLSSSVQLGLYVVGKLAERYGVQVTLKRSPYKGTTAVVIIPRELLEEGESGAPSQSLTVVGATMPEVTDPMESGGRERFTPVLVPSPPEEPLTAPVPDSDAPLPVRQTKNREQDQAEVTSSGLPVRVPQASLAPSLRDETSGGEPPAEDDPGRSPEEIRRIVGAFQSGTLRGRAASVESETE